MSTRPKVGGVLLQSGLCKGTGEGLEGSDLSASPVTADLIEGPISLPCSKRQIL